ncbi:aldose 1-epimerase family protein [Microvirga subterranea]|uniref:Galactose mutarotase-like enzyme n=1 Tax=Microvirga subterranea TaxID=186651 RepID=A0A370HK62_9HYPH|nr:aldose 1-epimerase family protein [Microvirga subterranea]RDI58565.1 galactose mutarotase-like enzyme [Microvirga subterranea]
MLLTLSSAGIEALISPLGAELVRLRDEAGRDLLWNGDPAFWTGRSPLLFPIVGRLKNDRTVINGLEYNLKQHGFARTSPFDIVEVGPDSCQLMLRSSPLTLEQYPFDFELNVTYRADGLKLVIEAAALNVGKRAMPVSFGFHPAFRWPLPYGGTREAHEIRFERAETQPLPRLIDGLLGPVARRTPVKDRLLSLHDDLFADGALIFDQLESRTVDYGVPGRRSITVSFPNMPHLGIWTKPGAGFVCIEPWQGYASPTGFDGELVHKPGIVLIGPGDRRRFSMDIKLTP